MCRHSFFVRLQLRYNPLVTFVPDDIAPTPREVLQRAANAAHRVDGELRDDLDDLKARGAALLPEQQTQGVACLSAAAEAVQELMNQIEQTQDKTDLGS